MGEIENYSEQPLTRQLLLSILQDYKRPFDKISELLKEGELTTVKRGIYMAGPKSKAQRPEKFLLANHISGPSYISMESALSYHGMIPEKVVETTSASIEKSILYKTNAGRFRYTKIPMPYYAFGIESVSLTATQRILIATREKALCDKIVTTPGLLLRSVQQTKSFLTENMRIDRQILQELNTGEIESWLPEAPKASSLKILIKTLDSL